MITLSITRRVKKGKLETQESETKLYHSMDQARKEIKEIVKEMRYAQRTQQPAKIRIDGVSYDTNSEKVMLLELGAIVSIENESQY